MSAPFSYRCRAPAQAVLAYLLDREHGGLAVSRVPGSTDQLRIRTKVSLWSWGEFVEVRVVPEGPGSRIYMRSSRVVPTAVLGPSPDRAIGRVVYAIEGGLGRLELVP